jgi:hypothetical protein
MTLGVDYTRYSFIVRQWIVAAVLDDIDAEIT